MTHVTLNGVKTYKVDVKEGQFALVTLRPIIPFFKTHYLLLTKDTEVDTSGCRSLDISKDIIDTQRIKLNSFIYGSRGTQLFEWVLKMSYSYTPATMHVAKVLTKFDSDGVGFEEAIESAIRSFMYRMNLMEVNADDSNIRKMQIMVGDVCKNIAKTYCIANLSLEVTHFNPKATGIIKCDPVKQ